MQDTLKPMTDYLSKPEIVVRALREMISSGQMVPGQRLKLEELSRMLGVSITPIREAIRILEAEGLLHGKPHRGVTVEQPSADDMEDICRIRAVLEELATRQAVLRSDPEVFASTLERLELLQKQMEACIKSGTLGPLRHLNAEFHLRLYELCRSPYLIDMIRRLWMQLPGYVWESSELSAAIVQQHRPILEALRARLSEAATQSMQAHIELSAAALLRILREREARSLGSPVR
jgi:DNA-binding GntR family transcriptional regulator